QELFANGPHVAAAAFEIGGPNLDIERSVGIDVSITKQAGPITGRVGGFYNRFDDYITLVATGAVTEPGPPEEGGEEEEPLPIFEYRNLAASFIGFEAELLAHAFESDPHHVDVRLRADYVRAEDRDRDQPLPRISPLRFGGSIVYRGAALDSHFDVLRVQSQHRVAGNELPTDGYTMVDLGVSYPITVGPTTLEGFLKGTNLLDEEARNSVSFLKDIAPLPGRGVVGGVRVVF
ncbi:MAG: TonB-dependent receptor, partial [Candidatus Binatia bacterium]